MPDRFSGARLALALAVPITLIGAPFATLATTTDPEGTVVQELVVTAKHPGPAWWKISSPASTIYVLGVVGGAPKGFKWDASSLRRNLEGANEVIVPPVVSAGLGDIFALISIRNHFRSRTPMETALPPSLRDRFLADRPRLSDKPKAYSDWTPLAAALFMMADLRAKDRVDPAEPVADITRIARRQGVKVTPVGVYRAVPVFRAAEKNLTESGPACVGDALDEIEGGIGRFKVAADGWTRGDVATALSAPRGIEKCVNSLPEGADVVTRSMADTASAMDAALAKPGHSVAVVNLRVLLAEGGVLQRLKAKGYRISAPDQE